MMNKNILLVALSLIMVFSCAKEENTVGRLVENYALVTIPAPDLTGITDNGKEVLKLYFQTNKVIILIALRAMIQK